MTKNKWIENVYEKWSTIVTILKTSNLSATILTKLKRRQKYVSMW